jgi:two-component system, cell cycle sensor histidine kinase and response regulator CckA
VRVDPAQLEQVLLNLAVNARDAMPAGGRLTIETSDVTLDPPFAAGHPERRPGEFVAIKVSDNGAGMDDETQRRIFEPFFTTKELGKGTGMGLAIVLGIVKMSDGWIEVESASGQGTTFTIYLLKVDEEPAADATAEAPEVPRGSGTVLFVEDDPSVRSFSVRCLRALGYTVLEASKGTDAITIATEYEDRIDLLVSDIVMPGMQGPEVAERIAALRPSIRVLLISGFAERAGNTGSWASKTGYLAKPYSRQSLGRAVSAALADGNDLR